MSLQGVAGAAGRISDNVGQMAQDRLELIALETREAKVRLLQFVTTVCMGIVFTLLGCVLLLVACLFTLPPEWRLYGVWGATGVSLLVGLVSMLMVRSALKRSPLAYGQTIAEFKKDAACFSQPNS